VIDILNMDEQIDHHRKAYRSYDPNDGEHHMTLGYSSSVGPYAERGVFDNFYSEAGQTLLSIVDPYEFRDRLDLPKYIINSSGDQFFLPDGLQFYYDDMPGENLVAYMPNTDHGLSDASGTFDLEMLGGMLAYYISLLNGDDVPQIDWTYGSNGNTLSVTTDYPAAPTSVLLWQAHNDEHRDFRRQNVGKIWQSSPVVKTGNNYTVTVPNPQLGWTGYFVQVKFNGPVPGVSDVKFVLTTPIRIVPDVYPAPYDGLK